MGKMIEAGMSEELADGTMEEVFVAGREILIARIDDKYYAIDNRCPHMNGKLSQGKLEGTIVTCPRHGSQFDLKDGSVVRWLKGSGFVSMVGKALKSPHSVTTYNVKVSDDKIFVEI
jgi:3-phenylpropionate/trans-cinnamate dioxygenase ferredoxin subunit